MMERIRDDWRVVVAVVSGGHFFSHFFLLSLPPIFPLLGRELGLNNAELGLVVSIVAIGGLLQAPVGNVVDRLGARWVFVAGVGVTAGGTALIGVGGSYAAILLLAAISGIGQAAFHPADYALIDTVTAAEIRGRAFSVHTFSGFAGAATAPIVVGAVAFSAGWRFALLLAGGIGVLYAVFAAIVLASSNRAAQGAPDGRTAADPEPKTSLRSAIARPAILGMAGFFLVFAFANRGVHTFTPVLAVSSFGTSDSVGNAALTAFFALGAIGVLAGGVLADRYAPERIITGTLAVGASFLLVTVTGAVPVGDRSLVVFFGVVGFFVSIVMPSRDRLVSDLSASGSMGQSFGIAFTGGAIGMLVGPVVLGAVGDAASITTSFVLVAGLYLVACVLAVSVGRGWLSLAPARTPAEGD